MKPHRLLFLDIDGVLMTERSTLANGVAWSDDPKTWSRLDMTAVGMIRRVCKDLDIKIILSSSWRISADYKALATVLDLPIIGQTEKPSVNGSRVIEILHTMENYEGADYVVVDDMRLSHFGDRLVQTQFADGFLMDHYYQICKYFDYNI